MAQLVLAALSIVSLGGVRQMLAFEDRPELLPPQHVPLVLADVPDVTLDYRGLV